jgi:hypothetical protein
MRFRRITSIRRSWLLTETPQKRGQHLQARGDRDDSQSDKLSPGPLAR